MNDVIMVYIESIYIYFILPLVKRGWTPLHYAVNANWFQAAEMLVYLGADTDKKDKVYFIIFTNDILHVDLCAVQIL